MQSEAEKIAAGLNETEHRAIARLSDKFSDRQLPRGWATKRTEKLIEIGLAYRRRLTPLGLQVRALLENSK